ncbi:MAG: hypothetical protein AB7F88_09830 [Pyrinomonadaceae bacterium]
MIFRSTFLLLFLVCLSFSTLAAGSGDPKLDQLRTDFARRYLQPDAHFALAKYYLDRGNQTQAFFILEYARRFRFEEKGFDKAYFAYFGDPMPEPPESAKASFEIASKKVAEQKYEEAERHFLEANRLYDRSFFINAWIGRFYYKAKSDPVRALPFYFKAYFLYPHAYETEYVESRIRSITISDAKRVFKMRLDSTKSLNELAGDHDPLISGMALAEIARAWKPEYLTAVLEAMNNDDSLVRWGAFKLLFQNAGTSREKFIEEMASGPDLRKRGLQPMRSLNGPARKSTRFSSACFRIRLNSFVLMLLRH